MTADDEETLLRRKDAVRRLQNPKAYVEMLSGEGAEVSEFTFDGTRTQGENLRYECATCDLDLRVHAVLTLGRVKCRCGSVAPVRDQGF